MRVETELASAMLKNVRQIEARRLIREELGKARVLRPESNRGNVVLLVKPETAEDFREAVRRARPGDSPETQAELVESLIREFLKRGLIRPSA